MTYFRQDLAHFKPYRVEKLVQHNLGDNENRLIDWSFLLKEVLETASASDVSFYGDNAYAGLIEAYADYLGVDPAQIVQGVGSNQLIHMIIITFLSQEDLLLTVDPDFFMYSIFSQMHRNKIEVFPFDWSTGQPVFQVEAFLDHAKACQAKAIILSNPNNPMSTAFSEADLEKILREFSGLVILDEAYIDYADCPSFVYKTKEYSNLIVLRTLSKAYGLAGLRLGFAVASPQLAHQLHSVLPPYSMPNIVAKIGQTALAHSQEVAAAVAETKRIREDFIAFLQSQPDLVVLPSQTSFVTFTAPYAEKIYQAGMAQDYAFKYYPEGALKNFIRMTIGRADEMEKMKELIASIAN